MEIRPVTINLERVTSFLSYFVRIESPFFNKEEIMKLVSGRPEKGGCLF